MQTNIETLQIVKDNLEQEMWKLHQTLGGTYNNKLDQIKDAKKLGQIATAIDCLNKTLVIMYDLKIT